MDLASCAVGDDVVVVALLTPPQARLRMHEVGLRVGSVVRITQQAPFGGRVVAVGASRIAVDGATAARVEVRAPQ